jgi:gluconolactonase
MVRSHIHRSDRNSARRFAFLGLVIAFAGMTGAHLQAQAPAAAQRIETPAPGAAIVRLDPSLDAIIAPGTRIERVATGFKFVEGPMWHHDRLWFSDLVGNRIYAVSSEGKVEMLLEHAGGLKSFPPGAFMGSNAMAADRSGSVLLIEQGGRQIVRLNRDLSKTPFLATFQGKRLNSPNDLVFAPDGSLWFTDPPYGLPKQNHDPGKELSFNGVYRYADGRLTAVIRDLPTPNGIGFSADGRTLYISNSGPQMYVEKFSLDAHGNVIGRSRLISYPGSAPDVPDGLKLDSAGNLWSSGPGGIRIIRPDGKVLGQIKLPEVAANLAWGDDGKTAYITASTSIYRVRLLIPGALPLYR